MDNWFPGFFIMVKNCYQGRFTSTLLTLSSLDHLQTGPPILHLRKSFPSGLIWAHFFHWEKCPVWAEFRFPFLCHPLLTAPIEQLGWIWTRSVKLFKPSPTTLFSTFSFMNISSTDQAGVSPFEGGELEKGHFEVVCLLPALENVLQPILNHFPLRFFHFLHKDIGRGNLHIEDV